MCVSLDMMKLTITYYAQLRPDLESLRKNHELNNLGRLLITR